MKHFPSFDTQLLVLLGVIVGSVALGGSTPPANEYKIVLQSEFAELRAHARNLGDIESLTHGLRAVTRDTREAFLK